MNIVIVKSAIVDHAIKNFLPLDFVCGVNNGVVECGLWNCDWGVPDSTNEVPKWLCGYLLFFWVTSVSWHTFFRLVRYKDIAVCLVHLHALGCSHASVQYK
jgi:hypothetical protein